MFEETQELLIKVFDINDFNPNANLEQEFIGSVQFFLHDLVRSQGQAYILPLSNGTPEKLGDIVITSCERKRGTRSTYRILFEGQGFPVESIFYRLYKILDNGKFAPIFESETSKRHPYNPVFSFQDAIIHSAALIQDDENRKAMIEVFEWYFFIKVKL